MHAKRFSVDKIFQTITQNNNFTNWILLTLNRFPSLLYGKAYRRKKQLIDKPFNYESTLLSIVNKAIDEVPYYNKKYARINDISEFSKQIDFIDKDIVIENYQSFFSEYFDSTKYITGTTGGTSGKSMKITIPRNRYNFELPVVHSFWERVGWNYNKRAVIRNHKLSENQNYKINPITKEIIFDAFRLNNEYISIIHNTLKKHHIQYIQAYPSTAFLFCTLCKKLNLDLNFLKGIFTSSEAVLDFQRNLIVNELKIPLYNFYGHSEKLVIGGYCEKKDYIHFEPSYGYAELIDQNGNTINTPGEIGEIVATGFNNPGMPLIRYKTGDFAEYVGKECKFCGRKGLIVRNIIGHHTHNLIYKKDGTYTSTAALNLHNNLLNKINGMQYIQTEKGHLTVNIIKNDNFLINDEIKFLKHFKNSMGSENVVELNFTTKLKSLPNGKFPLLISSINDKFL